MADTKTLIEQAYSAFNKRDIEGALALMTDDVSWPRASEGGSGRFAAGGQPTGRVLPPPVAVGVYPGRLGGWQAVRSETGLVRLAPRIRRRSPSGAAGGTRSKAVVLEMER